MQSVQTRLSDEALTKAIVGRMASNRPCLLAIDAPLGWSVALGQAPVVHEAGGRLTHVSDDLFRRSTDRFVKRMIGK